MFKWQITPDAKHEAIIFFFFTFEPINVCLCVPALFFFVVCLFCLKSWWTSRLSLTIKEIICSGPWGVLQHKPGTEHAGFQLWVSARHEQHFTQLTTTLEHRCCNCITTLNWRFVNQMMSNSHQIYSPYLWILNLFFFYTRSVCVFVSAKLHIISM